MFSAPHENITLPIKTTLKLLSATPINITNVPKKIRVVMIMAEFPTPHLLIKNPPNIAQTRFVTANTV
jgi:hypothetical protein